MGRKDDSSEDEGRSTGFRANRGITTSDTIKYHYASNSSKTTTSMGQSILRTNQREVPDSWTEGHGPCTDLGHKVAVTFRILAIRWRSLFGSWTKEARAHRISGSTMWENRVSYITSASAHDSGPVQGWHRRFQPEQVPQHRSLDRRRWRVPIAEQYRHGHTDPTRQEGRGVQFQTLQLPENRILRLPPP